MDRKIVSNCLNLPTLVNYTPRTVITPPANGGLECPALEETQSCNEQPCPVDCVVSDWSEWDTCSTECGGGIQTHTRTIITQPANGGLECPALEETQECNTQPCPIDCEVTNWSEFSTCSETCDGGTQTRTRTVITQPANGGQECPALVENQACNEQSCPINCVVSDWDEWGTCSTECGGGTQTHTRTIITPPANGGLECPVLEETQECNTQPCPIDCEVSDWSEWNTCSESCGGGTKARTRTIITPPANGGQECPTLEETQECNTQPCPIDCVVSDWSEWDTCSETCGGGTKARTRTIITQPANGGQECPTLVEDQACNEQPCPVNCVVSDWDEWGTCSTECGGGSQTHTRTIITQPANGGQECPALVENQACNEQPCPIDCEVSDWSEFSTCSETCGAEPVNENETIF